MKALKFIFITVLLTLFFSVVFSLSIVNTKANANGVDPYDPSVLTEEDHQSNYYGPVVISIEDAVLYLRGEEIDPFLVVHEIGNYDLVIIRDGQSHQINFTIHPNFIGVTNNEIIEGVLELEIVATIGEDFSFKLNDEDYEYLNQTHVFDKAGTHNFVFSGHGGYNMNFEFFIQPTVEGINYDPTHTEYLSFTTNSARVTLNGTEVTDFSEVGVAGSNSLHFYTVDNVLWSAYNFWLEPTYNLDLEQSTLEGTVKFDISAGEVLLNGDLVARDFELKQPGQHTVIISGNNYQKQFSFMLLPVIEGVEHQAVYFRQIRPQISGGTITLNGSEYHSNETISAVGNHTLIIQGRAGYERVIQFTIHPNFEGIENEEVLDEPRVLQVMGGVAEGFTFKLNDEDFTRFYRDDVYDKAGTYTFEYTGPGAYGGQYRFSILSYLEGINFGENHTTYLSFTTNYATVTLNGDIITDYSQVGVAGDNALRFYDINNQLRYTYSFRIEPTFNEALNNASLEGEVSLDISAGEVTVNGLTVPNDYVLTTPGNQEVIIFGNNFRRVFNFILHPIIEDIVHQGIYYGRVTPAISGGDITLNGRTYNSGEPIDEIGHHRLIIQSDDDYENIIDFTVHPIFHGVNANSEVNGTVSLRIEGQSGEDGTFTLNGEVFTTFNETVTYNKAGAYRFEYTGVGDYSGELVFTIKGYIEGVSNNHSYHTYVDITTNYTTIKLNGVELESLNDVGVIGENILTFYDKNGEYQETVRFTILPNYNPQLDEQVIVGQVTLNITAGDVKVNGEPVERDHTLNQPGIYDVVIDGHNYQKVFSFRLDPEITGLIDHGEYYQGVVPNISGGTFTLNGSPFALGDEVKEVGHHQLIIHGENGYEKTFEFTIHPQFIGREGVLNNHLVIDHFETISVSGYFTDSTSIKLNGTAISVDDTIEIQQIGTYVFDVFGRNDYHQQFSFNVVPNLGDLQDNHSILKKLDTTIFGGEIYINGERFECAVNANHECPIVLDAIGYYELVIQGLNQNYKHSFVIEPEILDNEGALVHLESLYNARTTLNIFGNIASLKLNGEPLDLTANAQQINYDFIGHYTLEITGINGYVKKLKTTISLPEDHNFIYDEGFFVDYKQFIFESDDERIPQVDTTKIKVNFIPLDESTRNGFQTLFIKQGMSPVLDKIINEHLSHYEYTATFKQIGHYEVTIFGEGQYTKQVRFTILPYRLLPGEDLAETLRRTGSIEFAEVHPDTRIEVLDITAEETLIYAISFNTNPMHRVEFTTFGNYVIRLVNDTDASFQESAEFTVASNINIPANQERGTLISIDADERIQTWFLNGVEQPVDQPLVIRQHGTNVIRVVGFNDYTNEYTVDFANPYRGFIIDNIVIFGLALGFAALSLVARRGAKYG